MIGRWTTSARGRFRALRHRLGWRQVDVGQRAELSQDVVSLVEVGRIAVVSVRALRRHAQALGGELRIELWFRGGELDRLMDEGHAALVGAIAGVLASHGWETRPEVSFAVFAERGSIDLVAWHAPTRTLLVVEVKTRLTSIEETLRRHDAKARLAAQVVSERFGWRPARVGRLLVLPDDTTARRHVRRHDAVLEPPKRCAAGPSGVAACAAGRRRCARVPVSYEGRSSTGRGVAQRRVRAALPAATVPSAERG